MEVKKSKILLLSHISDLSGPTEALEDFLVKMEIPVLHSIYNPLEYCRINKRVVKLYVRGDILHKVYPPNFKKGRVFTWFLDCAVSLYYSLRFNFRYNTAICCDGLLALVGLLLKKLGRVEGIIYYSIDWTPIRFKNWLLNFAYQTVTKYTIRHSNSVWCVSKRLVDLQVKKGLPYYKIQYVPVGVAESSRITLPKDFDYKALVFLGALERTKGIDLVIEAFPHLIKEDSQFKLIIIGKTPGESRYYEEKLSKMKNVIILGVLPHNEVLKTLPKYGVGLAPYSLDNGSVSFYGDPSRIKDYLACGLPVVVTSVPEIAVEIENNNAGKIIDFSVRGLLEGVKLLTKDIETYYSFRNNAGNLAKRYSWDAIFKKSFEEFRYN